MKIERFAACALNSVGNGTLQHTHTHTCCSARENGWMDNAKSSSIVMKWRKSAHLLFDARISTFNILLLFYYPFAIHCGAKHVTVQHVYSSLNGVAICGRNFLRPKIEISHRTHEGSIKVNLKSPALRIEIQRVCVFWLFCKLDLTFTSMNETTSTTWQVMRNNDINK